MDSHTSTATLHQLFGRHRHHTAKVVSKTRAKLKFLRWDQLLSLFTMEQTRSQKVAEVPHPGPVVFSRIRDAAIARYHMERREQHVRSPGSKDEQEGCALEELMRATRFTIKLQRAWRGKEKNRHRTEAQRFMKGVGAHGLAGPELRIDQILEEGYGSAGGELGRGGGGGMQPAGGAQDGGYAAHQASGGGGGPEASQHPSQSAVACDSRVHSKRLLVITASDLARVVSGAEGRVREARGP